MNLEFLRGACVIIEGNGTRVMCDPWLCDGIYYGAWAHYPPFTDQDWASALDPPIDYYYISHIHPDHFDAKTMALLPKKPVLIHEFKAKFLRTNIEALGFEVRELPHGHPVDLGGLKIEIFAADGCDPAACMKFFGCSLGDVADTQIDSMAIFDDGKEVYANVNDCPYLLSRSMLPQVVSKYPNIDLALIAYAGAGPYPQCFPRLSHGAKMVAANEKAATFIKHIRMFTKDLNAKEVFPFAGDYVLQGKLSSLNEYRGIPEIDDVAKALSAEGLAVSWPPTPNRQEKQDYIDTVLAGRKLDYEDDPLPEVRELERLCVPASERAAKKAADIGFKSRTAIYVDVADNWHFRLLLDGEHHSIAFANKSYDSAYIRLTVDPRLLKRLLMGPKYAHWNNAEIGSHIMFDRHPNIFERGISQIMSFFHC